MKEPQGPIPIDPVEGEPSCAEEPVAEPSLDLEAMTTAVHDRLSGLMQRMKDSERDAKALGTRLKPLLDVRKSLREIVSGDHKPMAAISRDWSAKVQAAREVIGGLAADLGQQLDYRRAVAHADDVTALDYDAVTGSQLDEWSRASSERAVRGQESLSEIRRRLESNEMRWCPEPADQDDTREPSS